MFTYELWVQVLEVLEQHKPELAKELRSTFSPSLSIIKDFAKLAEKGFLPQEDAVKAIADYYTWYMTLREAGTG